MGEPLPVTAESEVYAVAFLLCESVLLEEGGIVSAVRVIDGLAFSEAPPEGSGDIVFPSKILLIVKGRAGSEFEARIDWELQGRDPVTFFKKGMVLANDKTGLNIRIEANLSIPYEKGVHHLRPYLNGRPLMPYPVRMELPAG